MSKKLATRQSTAVSPAVKEELAKRLAEVRKRVEIGGGRMIRTKGKRFTFPDGTKVNEPIDVVIIDFMAWNNYFDEPYDESNPIPPVCYAFNEIPRDMAPSPNCKEPQVEEGQKCSDCPFNKFGSAERGKGKACQNRRVLAVLPADADSEDEIMLVSSSPTSIGKFDAYVSDLEQEGYLPVSVITQLDFDDEVDFPSLIFENMGGNPDVEYYFQFSQDAKDMLTREPSYEEEEEEAKPKAAPKKKAVSKKKALAKKKTAARRRS